MSAFFLGVDIGGTKSHALIADETGRALGFGLGGPGNPEGIGTQRYAALMREIVGQALATAGITRDQIAGSGYGIAGYDFPSERAQMLTGIEPLGIAGPFEIVNDAMVGMLAGADEGWGLGLVAGTGTNCWGWDRNRRTGRVTGTGMRLGEYGGAGELVAKAIHAVSAEWSMRGPATRLSQALIERVGAADLDDFIEGISLRRYRLDHHAAPLIVQIAEQGDPVARGVLDWSGRELGGLAVGVIRQLRLQEETFEVVLVGSLFLNAGPMLTEPAKETILAEAPHARFVRLEALPVVGGVILGMQMAGLDPRPVRHTLIETAAALYRQCAEP